MKNPDYGTIRDELKKRMSEHPSLRDYDFEGSVLSSLLDVLAYNTHMNALLLNFGVNESFIDTAQLRSSVISHSKITGYVPKSINSASFLTDISVQGFDEVNPIEYILPTGTKTTSQDGNQTFTFQTVDDFKTTTDTFTDVLFYEGIKREETFTIENNQDVLVLRNKNIDTRTIRVSVTRFDTNNTFPANRALSLHDLEGDSSADYSFLISESPQSDIEVFVGFGAEIRRGDVVTVTYLVSSGDKANGARSFTSMTVPDFTNGISSGETILVNIVPKDPASGGSNKEEVESIARNATMSYNSSGRAVSKNDHSLITQNLYPNAENVSVWGGEENDPVRFGSVFVSVKPQGRDKLTDTEKDFLIDEISRRTILGTEVIVVDPETQGVIVNMIARHRETDTPFTSRQLERRSKRALDDFIKPRLTNTLSRSEIEAFVATISSSIKSVSVDFSLRRDIEVFIGSRLKYEEFFTQSIVSSTLVSSPFTTLNDSGDEIECIITGDNQNLISLRRNDTTRSVIRPNIGRVIDNKVVIDSLFINDIRTQKLRLTANPVDKDLVFSNKNIILSIQEDDINTRFLSV